MADLNKVFLIGRLTRDVELRHTESGTAVCDLTLAVNRKWTAKDGQAHEEVLFIDVTTWQRQAESCAEFLAKGSEVHVEGRLKVESWEDKATGEKKSRVKVESERVTFLGRKKAEAVDDG
jgi:single-strand DNA-binding protein